jgi:hypothetical protein
MIYNKVLDLTPGSIVALRGILLAGAFQHSRYAAPQGGAR